MVRIDGFASTFWALICFIYMALPSRPLLGMGARCQTVEINPSNRVFVHFSGSEVRKFSESVENTGTVKEYGYSHCTQYPEFRG
jgi:hypothetical protein